MIRSLRARLLLLVLVVVGLAIAAASILSGRAVRTEFLRLETTRGAARLDDAATLLEAWMRQTGSLTGSDSLLTRVARSTPAPADRSGNRLRGELLLVGPDPGRAILAASAPEYRTARVEAREGGLGITLTDRNGGNVRIRRALLMGLPRAPVHGPDGTLRATLYLIPRLTDPESRPAPFIVSVNRWLLLAALASGAFAVLLTVALSRRILGPVEALTRAVRRMERGDLSQRVPVRSSDEIGELARAFNGMAASLEENEASRRRLLGDVAHELRTPLTNLRCQIEAVEDGLAAADAATMRSLHEETLLMGRLVEDIQDLALAEAGRLPLHREPVPVRTALDSAAAAFATQAAERTVSIHVNGDDRGVADADPARLQQVIRNLLANAIAHTPPGGSVSLAAAADEGRIVVSVRDNGTGILPEHLPHVFDRFYRADASRSRSAGGSGLGLAIVKQLVEAHGGEVAVASTPGQGTEFRVTLPAAPSS